MTIDLYSKTYSKQFTAGEVEAFRALTLKKNAPYHFNNHAGDSQNRWIGTPVELTIKQWFEEIGFINGQDFHYLVDDTHIDPYDFNFGRLNIDVKGMSTNRFPEDYYACWVYDTQWEKIVEDERVNALAWGFFDTVELVATVVGWLPKYEFMEKMKYSPAGTVRGFELKNADYSVRVRDLRPLMDLDRFK